MAFHKWVSTDTPEYDACLVCGGMWVNSNPGSVVLEIGQMTAMNGDPASGCCGNLTQTCHHYHGECPEPRTVCLLNLECNCVLCVS